TPVTTTRRRTSGLKIAVGSKRSAGRWRKGSSILVPGVLLDVLDRFADIADLLGLFVGDLDAELLLEGHHQLDDVQRIRSQIIGEAGLQGDLILVDAELLHDDRLDPL